MPQTAEQLFSYLDNLGIRHETVNHPAVFTAADAANVHVEVPGLQCKNLFVKNSKDGLWLVVMPATKRADLKRIAASTGSGKLSFASPPLLLEVLGLTPGAVTPFALLNDTQKRVTVVLDHDMMQAELVNYHPLHNEASTVLRSVDLLKFIESLGYVPVVTDCGQG